MTSGNGNKVSVREFYEKVEELQRDIVNQRMGRTAERNDMEVRLANLFINGLDSIRGDMRAERATCNARLAGVEGDIVSLKVADRRWGGIVGLFAAGMAGIGAWLGQR
jgi:hypothetical protein